MGFPVMLLYMEETLGQRIRRLRQARHWSQDDLAALLEVSGRTVGNWERDEASPRNRLGALEDVFGVSFRDSSVDVDPVVAALQRSALTEDRQFEVIGFYKRQLRLQAAEEEVRGA